MEFRKWQASNIDNMDVTLGELVHAEEVARRMWDMLTNRVVGQEKIGFDVWRSAPRPDHTCYAAECQPCAYLNTRCLVCGRDLDVCGGC